MSCHAETTEKRPAPSFHFLINWGPLQRRAAPYFVFPNCIREQVSRAARPASEGRTAELRLRLRALRACGGRPARSPAVPATRLSQPSRIETAPASGLALRATFGRLDPCRPVGLMAGPKALRSRPASRSPAAPATRLGFLRPSGLAVPAQPGLIGRSGQRPQAPRSQSRPRKRGCIWHLDLGATEKQDHRKRFPLFFLVRIDCPQTRAAGGKPPRSGKPNSPRYAKGRCPSRAQGGRVLAFGCGPHQPPCTCYPRARR